MLCNCKQLKSIKLEADIGAEPIWCLECGYNLDLDGLRITDDLLREIEHWSSIYGEWIDWDSDTLKPNASELEYKHNSIGENLANKLAAQLNGKYKIKFSPSSIARKYLEHFRELRSK
ncbi:hypothetical protein H1Z61_06560 [Bacillus aquiflavi]|uniref:Uncharacterized protein n=1 Tax=Bacillus aquiflavi TaxID=2672567 RepID=A0A6B3VZL4_9BACI|nr:hypothetical protein [Bacillus aquiflavi]MBA4536816.1 hypothetical protein [Bacillus aquiflavi]NEY81183.1 hypothetical protein [Bacillus aquiflavi]UAC49744.1 hypothetical protein K6959_08115 [Bacillus aquiflavi]